MVRILGASEDSLNTVAHVTAHCEYNGQETKRQCLSSLADLPHGSVKRSRSEWSVGSVSMAREEGDGTRARLGDMYTRGRVATADQYTTQ